MINYTERIALLMEDICRRTPRLSFINVKEVLVFGRFGRSDAEGAFATCHCLTLPESEPGYYFWRDRATGELTRRSEWFVTKSPEVRVGNTRVKYLISFVLPRFCDQTLERSRKADLYPADAPPWLAKLDTVVHELYHIDPDAAGIRKLIRADGTDSPRSHGPEFYEEVAEMVTAYLAHKPERELLEFLQRDFNALTSEYDGVVATTFRNFPSFPQRYMEAVDMPIEPSVRVEPLKPPSQPVLYTEDDLQMRQFTDQTSRRLTRKGAHRAA
jgi:hypothetical protein